MDGGEQVASLDEFSREQVILSALRTTGRVAVADLAARFGVSDGDGPQGPRRAGAPVAAAPGPRRRGQPRRQRRGRLRGAVHRLPRAQAGDRQGGRGGGPRRRRHRDRLRRPPRSTWPRRSWTGANLVVVTNGLRLATLLMERSSARVLVLGGVLRRSAGSLVGPIGDVLTSRGRIAKGFFGLVGLSAAHGLMDISGRGGPDQARHGRGLRRGATACSTRPRSTASACTRSPPAEHDRRSVHRRRGARRSSSRNGATAVSRCTMAAVPTSHRGRRSARRARPTVRRLDTASATDSAAAASKSGAPTLPRQRSLDAPCPKADRRRRARRRGRARAQPDARRRTRPTPAAGGAGSGAAAARPTRSRSCRSCRACPTSRR